MADHEQELKEIKARVTALTRDQARAQVEKENAEARNSSAISSLQSEFGVSTTEEARSVLDSLEREAADATERAREALLRAGASV